MRTPVKANILQPGDRFSFTRTGSIKHVKAVRESGDSVFIDTGITSVTDLIMLRKSESVLRLEPK